MSRVLNADYGPRNVSGRPILRVGLDVGFDTTVFQAARELGELLIPKTHRVPTWVTYQSGDELQEDVLWGDEALGCRHELLPVHPLVDSNDAARLAFADCLRRALDPGDEYELWGVVHFPQGLTHDEVQALRAITHTVLDRTKYLDGALLMATGFGSEEVARKSIWIDVGAHAVRVAPVSGGTPAAGEARIVPGGCIGIGRRLRQELRLRFPDLALTDMTARRIGAHFGHVRPLERSCQLRLRFGEAERTLEIGTMVRRATQPIVEETLEALRSVLSSCPSDSIEGFLSNIVLAGGGARIQGLESRLRDAVREEFGAEAFLHLPQDPTCLVANGALRWAHFLKDEDWEVPLFVHSA